MLYPENDNQYHMEQYVSNEMMDFSDLQPIEIEVKYQGTVYFLREMSEDTHKWQRSMVMKGTKEVDGNTVYSNPDALSEIPAQLIHRCLFTQTGGDVKHRVSLDIIKSMPTRIISKMFIKVRQISGLEQEDTAESVRKEIERLTKLLEEIESRENSKEASPTS